MEVNQSLFTSNYSVSEEVPKRPGKMFKEIIKTVTKGSSVLGTKMLKQIAWLETQIIDIIVGSTTFSGRFRSKVLLGEKDEYRAWAQVQKRPSMIHYFHTQRSSTLSATLVDQLHTGVENVHYFSDEELSHFEVVVENQTLFTKSSVLSDWKRTVDSIAEKGNVRFSQFYEERKASTAEFTQVPDGEYLQVYTYDRRFYLIPVKDGEMHHTSISRGNAILGGGSIWIKSGKVDKVDNASGHYHPKICQLMNVLEGLEARGICPNSYSITFMTKENEKRVFTHVPKGEGRVWMKAHKQALLDKLFARNHHAKDNEPFALLERRLEMRSAN